MQPTAAPLTDPNGGILIILGMPEGSEFGIDMKIYQVGPRFRGISAIPKGLHLLTFGTGQGLHQGFFIDVTKSHEVIVKSWHPTNEEIIEEGTGLPEGAMSNLLQAIGRGELNANLGAYPEEQGKLWRNLTNCLDRCVLELCGLSLEVRVLPGDWEEEKLKSRTTTTDSAAVVPYFAEIGRTARFTDVKGEKKPDVAMTPSELTHYHLDRSARLEALILTTYQGDWKMLLGEYQLAFVLFLNLYSMGGWHHWKEMTALLCHCVDGLGPRSDLFNAWVRILFTQIKTIPDDFFEDEISKGSFLQPCLVRFVQNVRGEEPRLPTELREQVEHFAKVVETRFKGLDLRLSGKEEEKGEQEEDEEDPPVVVPYEEVEEALRRVNLEDESKRQAQGIAFEPVMEEEEPC